MTIVKNNEKWSKVLHVWFCRLYHASTDGHGSPIDAIPNGIYHWDMPKPKSDLTPFNIKFPTWLLNAVRAAAAKKGISVAEYVKDAIKAALQKDGK